MLRRGVRSDPCAETSVRRRRFLAQNFSKSISDSVFFRPFFGLCFIFEGAEKNRVQKSKRLCFFFALFWTLFYFRRCLPPSRRGPKRRKNAPGGALPALPPLCASPNGGVRENPLCGLYFFSGRFFAGPFAPLRGGAGHLRVSRPGTVRPVRGSARGPITPSFAHRPVLPSSAPPERVQRVRDRPNLT